MEKLPLVSIIVPIYNSEPYLNRLFDSILNQTYKNIELVLVNDGSTDNSLSICEKIAKKDKRVKIYSQTNGGASSARNLGLSKSNGDYITYVDSDDKLDLTFVAKMIASALTNKSDMVVCGLIRCLRTIENKDTFFSPPFSGAVIKEDYLQEALDHDCQGCSLLGKMFSKQVATQTIFPTNMPICEDLQTFTEFIIHSEQISCIKECLYSYIERPGSLSTSSLEEHCFYEDIATKKVETLLINTNANYIEMAIAFRMKFVSFIVRNMSLLRRKERLSFRTNYNSFRDEVRYDKKIWKKTSLLTKGDKKALTRYLHKVLIITQKVTHFRSAFYVNKNH